MAAVARRPAYAALVLFTACTPADDVPGRDTSGRGGTAATSNQRDSALSPSSAGVLLPGGAFRGVSARESQLIAVGRDSAGRGVVFLSNDGTRWTQVATQARALPSLGAVAAWRDGFVAFADSGSTILWTSKDGRAWTPGRPTPRAFADAVVTDVVAGGPGLVAVGARLDPGETDEPVGGLVWTSRDGATWERVPGDPAVFSGVGMSAITASRDGLVGFGGRIPDNVPELWVSRDGRTWTREAAEGPFDPPRGGVADLSQHAGRLVAVGRDAAGGAIWASDDGRSWTLVEGSRAR